MKLLEPAQIVLATVDPSVGFFISFVAIIVAIFLIRSRCRKPFMSSWPGERVCPKCKTTTVWREGTTLRDEYQ